MTADKANFNGIKERDSFIFYRSFYEAISETDDTTQLEVFKAITEYALDHTEPNLKGVSSIIFKLVKPQLDANWKRFNNGCNGGRNKDKKPKKNQNETEIEPKDNQDITKTEPNDNHNDNHNDNLNLNGNDNGNGNKECKGEDFIKKVIQQVDSRFFNAIAYYDDMNYDMISKIASGALKADLTKWDFRKVGTVEYKNRIRAISNASSAYLSLQYDHDFGVIEDILNTLSLACKVTHR